MDNKIKSYYLVRKSISEFFALCFNYGRARAVFVKKHRQITGMRQIIPLLLFYSTLIFLSVGIYFFPKALFISIINNHTFIFVTYYKRNILFW